MKQGLLSTIEEMQDDIKQLKKGGGGGGGGDYDEDIERLQSEIDTLETTTENHNTRINENASDIDGLDTRVTALEQATPPSPDLSNYYTKTQSDERYTEKATTSALERRVGNVESSIGNIETGLTNRYTKTETDNLLDGYYTKTQSDGRYASQTDLSTTNNNVATNASDIDGLDTRVTALESASPSVGGEVVDFTFTGIAASSTGSLELDVTGLSVGGNSYSSSGSSGEQFSDLVTYLDSNPSNVYNIKFNATPKTRFNNAFTETTVDGYYYQRLQLLPATGTSAYVYTAFYVGSKNNSNKCLLAIRSDSNDNTTTDFLRIDVSSNQVYIRRLPTQKEPDLSNYYTKTESDNRYVNPTLVAVTNISSNEYANITTASQLADTINNFNTVTFTINSSQLPTTRCKYIQLYNNDFDGNLFTIMLSDYDTFGPSTTTILSYAETGASPVFKLCRFELVSQNQITLQPISITDL